MIYKNQQKTTYGAGIGTKILLPVGATFIVLTVVLAILISVRIFNNLTNVKLSELERMSGILANNVSEMVDNAGLIARSIEQSESITREIEQISTFGPYYANPNNYFEPLSIAQSLKEIEDANQIFALQSNISLITQLQVSLQTNDLDSISFYLVSPFDIIPDTTPTLAFRVNHDQIVAARFHQKGVSVTRLTIRLTRLPFVPRHLISSTLVLFTLHRLMSFLPNFNLNLLQVWFNPNFWSKNLI